MTTEDDFQAALDANPDDHHTRLVFADWLQDRDDPRAAGYRMMGRLRHRPHKSHATHPNDQRMRDLIGLWGAWSWSLVDTGRPSGSQLKRPWWNRLTLIKRPADYGPPGSTVRDARYQSRREAEDDAALAFTKLPEFWHRSLAAEVQG